MKAYLILLLVWLPLTASAQTGKLTGADEEAIIQLLADQQDSWNEGNIDAFMVGYWKSDSLVFVGGSGAVYGWKNTLKGYHQRYPDRTAMGMLTFEILQMDALGLNHARILGRYHLKRTIGDASGTFTLIFYRFPDGWKIISDHTSASGQ